MIIESNSETSYVETRPALFDSGCRRHHTVALHYLAIKRAIGVMRNNFYDELTLQDIADAAQLSPFHFNRLFRKMTGISPMVFLAAIRLEYAKKLLLSTNRSITEICFDVGYRSLGTFTSRFSLLVGLPPSHFRALLKEENMYLKPADIKDAIQFYNAEQEYYRRSSASVVHGSVKTTIPFNGLIFVGLFSDPLPQGQPAGCAMLLETGEYVMSNLPDGKYYLFAATMDTSESFLTLLTTETKLYGRQGKYPVEVHNGQVKGNMNIKLERANWADPPMLIALPWLVLSRFMYQFTLYASVMN